MDARSRKTESRDRAIRLRDTYGEAEAMWTYWDRVARRLTRELADVS
jgi:adenylate cyclase class IV